MTDYERLMATLKELRENDRTPAGMSRFESALKGYGGEVSQKRAQRELDDCKAQLEAGKITIDENGAAFNCIGRPLMDDMAEKVKLAGYPINMDATAAARDAYCRESLAGYKFRPNAEQMAEMRAEFGEGTTVVNVITGETVRV